MTRKLNVALALTAALTLFHPGVVFADCFQRAKAVVQQVYTSHVQPYYHAVQYYYQPVAVFEPLKAVYAVGGGYQSDGASTAELARAIEKLTLAVHNQTQALKAPPAPETGPEAAALRIYNQHCASCHTPDKAEKAGGKFVLLIDGKLNPELDALDLTHAVNRVEEGSMPPKSAGPELPAEKLAVLREHSALLTKQARANGKGRK